MLQKSRRALLLSDVKSFSEMYRQLAHDIGVMLTVEAEWHESYRVVDEVVILGAKHLPHLNKAYYPKAVVILKSGESPAPYIKEGVSRFIFDHTNAYELITALFYDKPVVVQARSKEISEIVEEYGCQHFQAGKYDFKFDKDVYKYRGRPIYLCESQKRYLAEWLIGGHKDNKRRMILCNLRKKFGEDFLKDVNRFGEIKEEKDEQ